MISLAHAQTAAPAAPGITDFLPLIIIFILFWCMLIRPQMKRAKEHRKLVADLAVGDEVVTTGGLLGRISKVGESFLTVEVADNLQIKLQRHAVASVVPKGTIKSA